MKKKSLFSIYPSDGGCSFHRVLQPTRFCADHYPDWEFNIGVGTPPGHDVYYFSGLPDPKNAPATIFEIRYVQRKGAKFVWGIDDDWTSIPDWNPAKPSEAGLCVWDLMKMVSDYVIVSTDYLASTMSDIKEKVIVAQNLLDLTNFPPVEAVEFVDEDTGRRGKQYPIKVESPVRVLWTGSETHSGDVAEIEDVLDKFASEYCNPLDQRAVIIFQGMLPPSKVTRKHLHKGVFYQPTVPFASYQTVLNSINPHVYLSPMAQIPFNRAKSNLRVLEGWALMAPSVATDWGEYSSIKHGVDGLLAKTPDEYYEALVNIVTDHELRVSLASHGRMRLEECYNWRKEKCKKEWYSAFDRILGDL